MALTDDDVRRVAELVRIRLDETEVKPLGEELSRIFSWIEALREVDVAGVAPMASVVEMQLREREDAVTDGNCRDRILGNAPAAEDGHFVVPRVIE
ncbi:MAG: Asp-tRNA(Asn)/Glu-tRNA(Gln) amidotransferase subunit GatC [Rhodospirillales bacterium]|nr:Asp-tRNA(Asn)/Glu-tRNA(Gln) amidotransferase subunit GatC [Rhodospirillales bacterium]